MKKQKSNVLQFPNLRDEVLHVPLTTEQAALAAQGRIEVMKVYDDTSYADIGIYSGDDVVIQHDIPKTPKAGALYALIDANGETVLRDTIGRGYEVQGVVIGVYREPDAFGRFERNVA